MIVDIFLAIVIAAVAFKLISLSLAIIRSNISLGNFFRRVDFLQKPGMIIISVATAMFLWHCEGKFAGVAKVFSGSIYALYIFLVFVVLSQIRKTYSKF